MLSLLVDVNVTCSLAAGSVPIMVSDVILEEGCVEQEYVLDQSSRTGGGQDEVFLACKLEWSPAAEDFF